jgi:hypothetical protein
VNAGPKTRIRAWPVVKFREVSRTGVRGDIMIEYGTF